MMSFTIPICRLLTGCPCSSLLQAAVVARLADVSVNDAHHPGLLRTVQLCDKFIVSHASSLAELQVLKEEVAKALLRQQQHHLQQQVRFSDGSRAHGVGSLLLNCSQLIPGALHMWSLTLDTHCCTQGSPKLAAPARTRRTYASKPDLRAAAAAARNSSSKGNAGRLQQDQPAAAHPAAVLPTRVKQVSWLVTQAHVSTCQLKHTAVLQSGVV
jgi:hypothetical protein